MQHKPKNSPCTSIIPVNVPVCNNPTYHICLAILVYPLVRARVNGLPGFPFLGPGVFSRLLNFSISFSVILYPIIPLTPNLRFTRFFLHQYITPDLVRPEMFASSSVVILKRYSISAAPSSAFFLALDILRQYPLFTFQR